MTRAIYGKPFAPILLVLLLGLAFVPTAGANTGNVVIGAPTVANVYTLIITYTENNQSKNFDCFVNADPGGLPNPAVLKRDNLLAACNQKLLNNNITAFTLAAGGGSSISVSTVGAVKITNIQGEDKSNQPNTYTLDKQSTLDHHDALAALIGTSAGGSQVSVHTGTGNASVTTTAGQSSATVIDSLTAQLQAGGLDVQRSGNLLFIRNITSAQPLTVWNQDGGLTMRAGVGELRGIPALTTPGFMLLTGLLLASGLFLIQHRVRARHNSRVS
jgi:hypothetical protein